MTEDRHPSAETAAIAHLESLGLTSYAARTFVGVSSLGQGTAREISEVTEVPRTRIYDALEELEERGLVDLQRSDPLKAWAVSPETVERSFRSDFEYEIDGLRTGLDDLQSVSSPTEQPGVWTVVGSKAIDERVAEFIDGAENEVVFMCVESLLTESVVEALVAAARRGVDIQLGGVSPDVHDELGTALPDAATFDSIWEWDDSPSGRLLLVDRSQTLVGVQVDNGATNGRQETGIWGSGETNSLVVVVKALFTWQLRE